MESASFVTPFQRCCAELECGLSSFQEMVRLGVWKSMFAALVKRNKTMLDMSVIHIDGSHTSAQRDGENVEYQGRKK